MYSEHHQPENEEQERGRHPTACQTERGVEEEGDLVAVRNVEDDCGCMW